MRSIKFGYFKMNPSVNSTRNDAGLNRRTDFVVASLIATPDGRCHIRHLRSCLNGQEAVVWAKYRAAEAALIVGSPGMKPVMVILQSNGSTRANEQDVKARLIRWIEWLRSVGGIRLGALCEEQPEQEIPPEFLIEPDLLELLGIVLVPQCTRACFLDATCASASPDWLAAAPHGSIASLLAASPTVDASWLRPLPPEERCWLLLPVVSLTPAETARANGLRLGATFWQQHRNKADSMIATLVRLTVNEKGVVAIQEFPADRYGVTWWPPDGDLLALAFDAAYRQPSDFHFTSILANGEDLVRDALMDAVLWRRIGSPADENFSCENTDHRSARDDSNLHGTCLSDDEQHTVDQLARCVLEQIQPEIDKVRSMAAEHVYPFDGAASSVAENVYLYAGGDSLLQLRRRRALDTLPALMGELRAGTLTDTRKAIDEGRSLIAGLHMDTGVPQWAIRRTRVVLTGVEQIHATGFECLADLMHALEYLGPHAPRPALGDLKALSNLGCVDSAVSEAMIAAGGNNPLPNLLHILFVAAVGREATVRGWAESRKTLRYLADALGRNFAIEAYYHVAIGHVINVAKGVSTQQNLSNSEAMTICRALLSWFSQVTLSRLIENAMKWVKLFFGSVPTLGLRIPQTQPSAPLPPHLFGPCSCISTQVEARILLSPEDLLEESRSMAHCVNRYAEIAAAAESLIVALHHPPTGKQATLELVMADGQWCTVQLKGRANCEVAPNDPMTIAANGIKELLNQMPERLAPDALACYGQAAEAAEEWIMDFSCGDTEALGDATDPFRAQVEALFPGVGPFAGRIRHALKQCGWSQ